MKLPGGTEAIIEISKLRDYCLDPTIPAAGTRPVSFYRLWASRSQMPIFFAPL